MLKDKGNRIELDVIIEKFRKKTRLVKVNGKPLLDEDGKKVKEMMEVYSGFFTLPTTFWKTGITLYNPAINNQNRLYKTRSTIFDKYSQKFYVVNHSSDEIEQGLAERTIVGFKVGE